MKNKMLTMIAYIKIILLLIVQKYLKWIENKDLMIWLIKVMETMAISKTLIRASLLRQPTGSKPGMSVYGLITYAISQQWFSCTLQWGKWRP